jgi:hypothetical protein
MSLSISKITESIGHVSKLQPEWVRIPDAVRLSGIGRSRLYVLIDAGEIRSVCLRGRQKIRGIRLIHVGSLNDYIGSFEKEALNESA